VNTEPETTPHELSTEQLDQAVGASPAPDPKPVRETNNTVSVLLNSTY
jgi:hypothetical protein